MHTASLGDAAFERIAEAARSETRRAVVRNRLVWAGAALALAAAIAFAILLPANLLERRAPSDRVLRLASGSTVLLSPGTVATTHEEADGERVALQRGVAFFRVRPVRPGRSFVVESDLISATVI
jgi:ferric-dicitrate binding protein FerR (iron transport regulator)